VELAQISLAHDNIFLALALLLQSEMGWKKTNKKITFSVFEENAFDSFWGKY